MDPAPALLPAALAGYAAAPALRTGFPLLLAPDQALAGLPTLLARWQAAVTDGVARGLVADNLRRLEARVGANGVPSADAIERLRLAADALAGELSLAEEPDQALRRGLAELVSQVPADARWLDYGPDTAPTLVAHAVAERTARSRASLVEVLGPLVHALTDRLAVERALDPAARAPDALEHAVGDVGARFLDPTALSAVVGRTRGSAAASEDRVARLQRLRDALGTACGDDALLAATVICDDAEGPWSAVGRAQAHEAPVAEVARVFEERAAAVVQVLAAARAARLELADAYEPARHDAWVRALTWQDLTDEERRWLPVVIGVDDAARVGADGLASLTALVASGAPVQLVLERRSLAAFPVADPAMVALATRQAVVARTTPAVPDHLLAAVGGALESGLPGVLQTFDGHVTGAPVAPWLVAQAAVSARAHTLFCFDPTAGAAWTGVMAIGSNPEPERDWASSDDGEPFTLADAAWLDPALQDQLRPPTEVEQDRLVPLAAWLDQPSPEQRPVVQLQGPGGPEPRVVRTDLRARVLAARLDWWLLRELGGVANSHAAAAEARVRAEAEAELHALQEQAAQAQEAAVAEARAAGASEAMSRLAASLLETDFTAVARPVAADAPAPVVEAVSAPVEAEAEPAPAPPEEEDTEPAEPWIDSPLCTSCNDCIDINPQLFAYDANKQAEIVDPEAGTFEDLVRAAEKCPSNCIHPGAPLDPSEPGLDALLERAAPYR